jgi:hypothetical protein
LVTTAQWATDLTELELLELEEPWRGMSMKTLTTKTRITTTTTMMLAR